MKFISIQLKHSIVFASLFVASLLFATVHASAQTSLTLRDCIEYDEKTRQNCETESTTHMSPQQQMQMAMMNQQMQTANQQTAQGGANQAAQCLAQVGLNKALGGMSQTKGEACLASINECEQVCSRVGKAYPLDSLNTDRVRERCQLRNTNGKAALAQGIAFAQAALQALACVKMASSSKAKPSPSPTPPLDCNNPEYAKTNVVCICQADPKNAFCANQSQQGVNVSTGSGFQGPKTPGLPFGGAGDLDEPSNGIPATVEAGQAKPASGSNTTPDGGGGGPSLSGGGGGRGDDGGGGGYAPSNVDKSVITGQSGGAGGGSGGGGGGGYGKAGTGVGSQGAASPAAGFDMSKFLPNTKDFRNRGLAGMSVPSKDGITGPTGPTIWEKVSNQYQQQKPNLLQDR